MGICEMCGCEANVSTAKVAGTTMQVCSECKKLGTGVEKSSSNTYHKTFTKKKKALPTEFISSEFQKQIQKGLDKKNLNSHQLARAIHLKESQVSKYLSGKLQPDLETAKKIQHFLEVTLIEETQDSENVEDYLIEGEEEPSNQSLGDLIKEKLKDNGR